MAAINDKGAGASSLPSQRAKTKKDSAPGPSRAPAIQSKFPKHCIIMLDIPVPGGAPIDEMVIEAKDIDEGDIVEQRFDFKGETLYRFIKAKAGKQYQFRSLGVNSVGPGLFSPWSEFHKIPTEEELKAVANAAAAGKDMSKKK